MAKLPEIKSSNPLTRGPQSSVTPAEIADPFRRIAAGLASAADVVHTRDLSQAEVDGRNEGVYRDSDGKLHVNRQSDWSETGRRYNQAAEQRFGLISQNEIRTNLVQFANDAGGNVDKFKSSVAGFRDKMLGSTPEHLRGAVDMMFESEAPRVALGVSEQKRKRDLTLTEQSTKDNIALLMDDAAALARDGGVGTRAYKEAQSQIRTLYQGLVDNPDFAVSQDSVDIALKRMEGQNMSESMLGQVDRALASPAGITEARKLATSILTDRTIALQPSERRRYASLMEARIDGFVSERKAEIKPFQDSAKDIVKRLKQGAGLDSPDVDETAIALMRGGDVKGATELMRARTLARFSETFKRSDDATQVKIAEDAMKRPDGGHVVDRIIGVESGGNPNAKNPKSSATGAGQFINSTWLSMVRKYRPDVAEGKSSGEILAMRSDGDLSREMTGRYAQENAEFLKNQGIATTDANVYLAHFLGPRGASQVLKADPGASVASVVGQDVVNANSFLAGKNIADLRRWAAKKMGGGETLVLADQPEVVSEIKQEVASDLTDAFPGMERTLQSGIPIEPGSVSLLARQLAIVDDQDVKQKYTDLFAKAEAAGQLEALAPAEREMMVAALKADAAQGATVAQADIIKWIDDSAKEQATALKADPIGFGVSRKYVPPLPGFNADQPDTWAATFAASQNAVNIMQARQDVGNISALRPEQEQQIASIWQEGDPAKLGALTNSLSTSLNADTLRATLSNGAVKEALKGATLSTDPVKYSEAMKQLDLLTSNGDTTMMDLQRDFGEEAVNRLQDWQGMVRYYTGDEMQDWLKKRNDPAWQERVKPLISKGETEARKIESSEIVDKLDTNSILDANGPIDEQTNRMMMNDFVRLYGQRYSSVMDDDKAKSQAVERMQKVWGVTSAYGDMRGRVMPYPPEGFYPKIGEGHDYIAAELSELATSRKVSVENVALVADGKTKAQIDKGQLPGYLVSVVNPDTGMEEMMTDEQGRVIRHFFDPDKARIDAAAAADEERRTRYDPWLVLGPEFNIGPAFAYPGADKAEQEQVKKRTREIWEEQQKEDPGSMPGVDAMGNPTGGN